MSVLLLLAALLLEQIRPLPAERAVVAPMRMLADLAERHLNAGEWRHGVIAWGLLAGGLTLFAGVAHWLFASLNVALGWLWSLGVLYLTMGFRQVSHYFTDIHVALRLGEIDRARQLLAAWRGRPGDELGSGDIARLAIEEALKASHRHVFAVILWYALLPGPSGAVLYRVSCLLADFWRDSERCGAFGDWARRVFGWMDWLPQRVTATFFAIVGDFEDAIYCWRTQAGRWSDPAMGVILASGAGALGVRLGMPVVESPGEVIERPDVGVGEEADVDFMQSTVGLVWRSLVLWLVLLSMLSLARWVGT